MNRQRQIRPPGKSRLPNIVEELFASNPEYTLEYGIGYVIVRHSVSPAVMTVYLDEWPDGGD